MFNALGGVQSLGGYHEYIGGYHEYIRDIMIHVGEKVGKTFQFLLKTPMY